MTRYVFRGPTYRPFPYEQELAAAELYALLGHAVVRTGQELAVSVRRPVDRRVLERLAFSSWVEGPFTPTPTQTHLLEQSALSLRLGNGGNLSTSVRKESGYLTHGLHRYKGKFYPQLCRSLLNIAGANRGDLILDPFMGSGTTLVECALTDVDSIGFDLNPLAHLIAWTKLRLLQTPVDELSRALVGFERELGRECRRLGLLWAGFGSEEPAGDPGFAAHAVAAKCRFPEAADEIGRWFPPAVCHKLAAVLGALEATKGRAFNGLVRVCLSDQIRSVSQQDPRDLRIRRRSTPIDDAPLLTLLTDKLLKELAKLKAGLAVLGGPVDVHVASAELGDARKLHRREHPVLSSRRVDTVITSPPYANALPYIDTDRLSLLILGLVSARSRNQLQRLIIGNREIYEGERRALENEMQGPVGLKTFPTAVAHQIRRIHEVNRRYPVGFRRRNVGALLYQYFRDMRIVMNRLYDVTRVRGQAFIVLGDSTTSLGDGREVVIKTAEHVAALAEQEGWRAIDNWPITVTVEDFAHVKNAITENVILVLERA